jgi:hypothetical protein
MICNDFFVMPGSRNLSREIILDRHSEQLAFPPDAQERPAFLEELNTGILQKRGRLSRHLHELVC